MIHNSIHKILTEDFAYVGWDTDTDVMLLTQFIDNRGLHDEFAAYLQEIADEETESLE